MLILKFENRKVFNIERVPPASLEARPPRSFKIKRQTLTLLSSLDQG